MFAVWPDAARTGPEFVAVTELVIAVNCVIVVLTPDAKLVVSVSADATKPIRFVVSSAAAAAPHFQKP